MITIIGKSPGTISTIADNMESKSISKINVINNLGIPDYLPYKNKRFQWDEYDSLNKYHINFIIGATYPESKIKILDFFKIDTEKFINCIHDSAQISTMANMGKGILINSLVTVSAYSTIGNFVTIGKNAYIGHHSILKDFVTSSPSTTICGNVQIGRGTFIGAGAIIIDGITVGDNCIIGAGSVVVNNIPSGTRGYGNPFHSV